MTDAPGLPPEPRAPTGASPSTSRRSLLDRFFGPIRISREAGAELNNLATKGSLVFVMRSSGLLNFLYLRWFLGHLGLPELRAAQGFSGFFGWVARVRRSRRAFEDSVSAGQSSLIFLGRPHRRDPFASAVHLQRTLYQPVFFVPVLLVWSLRGQKLQPSLVDALYGSAEAPTAFATALSFLRSFRHAFFEVGKAVDLKAFLGERIHEADMVVARKVRSALHQHLARQFRTAVGPPMKAPHRVRDRVLRDRTLRAAIDSFATASGRPLAHVEAEARADFEEIASRYDPRVVEVMRTFFSWVFSRLYKSVEVDESGLSRLKRLAAESPIVLCPSHKSHVDYLVLSWLLYSNGMTPPHVAAGINLSFWPFGKIARKGGAFFIRRTVKGDKVYTAVLRAYVKYLLRERFPQEFYVEGGRSRTGKLLFPKTGLVSMEVDAWLDGAADDVMFVPVSIDYERLIEASSYVSELSGGQKRKESLGALLGTAKVLLRRYERLYIQFEEPVSLRKVAEERLGAGAEALTLDENWEGEVSRPLKALASYEHDVSTEAKRTLVVALSNRIAYGISRAVTLTPVGLLAASLLSHGRRGMMATEVARRVDLLRYLGTEGKARFARDLAGAPSDPRQPGPIADAVRVLSVGGLVHIEVAAGETIYLVPDEKRPVLDYHRNAVIHRYVAPSLVASSVLEPGTVTVEEVRARALFLSRLFKLEFMYRAGATFNEIFAENLNLLVRIGAVALEGESLRPGPQKEQLGFLAEFMHAYLEAYRLAAETARYALSGDELIGGLDSKALVNLALERGRADFLSGRIALRESLSKATLENAASWFLAQGVLVLKDGAIRFPDHGEKLNAVLEGIAPHLTT